MKNLFTWVVIILLAAAIGIYFVNSNKTTNETPTNTDANENIQTNEEQKPNTETSDVKVPDAQTSTEEKPSTGGKLVVKTDTGRYVGLADNNFFEVKISGVPDENTFKTFMITDIVRPQFEKLNLQKDDVVKIEYVENKYGQLEVQSIEKIS